MTTNDQQGRAPDLYGSIPDHLEQVADRQGAVSDYVLRLAEVRAMCAIASELAAFRGAVEGAAVSLDRIDAKLGRVSR